MNKKRNPLNLNPLQLKTLTLLQELAHLPEHATDGGDGRVMVSNLPAPHGDHFHVGAYAVVALPVGERLPDALPEPAYSRALVPHPYREAPVSSMTLLPRALSIASPRSTYGVRFAVW